MNKSCPFCGKKATIDTLNYTGGKAAKYRVQCQECRAATDWYDSEAAAWAAWNRRIPDGMNRVIDKNTFILYGLLYSRNPQTGNCVAQKEYRGKAVRIKEDVFLAAYKECEKITTWGKE
jgi:Lar family restriction alleviation protein